MCNRDIPDPSKIEDCRVCVKRACDICIPKATRLCPVCAMPIGSSQVPQHLFGTGGGGYSSHQDPNCTAATKCICIDLPSEPDAAGLRVWIANMKEAVSNAYSYDGLYVINWLTEVEKAKSSVDTTFLKPGSMQPFVNASRLLRSWTRSIVSLRLLNAPTTVSRGSCGSFTTT